MVNNIEALNNWIKNSNANKVFFMVDENTHEYCLPLVLPDLPDLPEFEILEVEPGEESKTLEVAANLWVSLLELEAERNDLIINIGGGVDTDLGGFVASTYKRGMRFANVPTSLLAMVDAALGGKTGIDFGGAKNMIGTFADADIIYSDAEFLKTLPENQLKSGFAEMLKHGLIADELHWKEAVSTFPNITSEIIKASAEIKLNIVANDPKEKGERKLLNFGHTIGHAFESFLISKELPILHGEAIAAGMIMESFLSTEFSDLSKESYQEIESTIGSLFTRIPLMPGHIDEVMEWLKFDKKNEAGVLKFSLLKEIGEGVYNIEIPLGEVKKAILNYLK